MAAEIRRLAFGELDPALRAALAAKVDRLGYLGEFFAVGGHQPAAMLAFHEFTESLKVALPDELTEVVALTCATELGNDYERSQHEQLAGRLGFGTGWIAAAVGRGDEANLSEAARGARALALAVLADHGHGAAGRLSAATALLGERVAVGLLLLVGRYAAHAAVSNCLELRAPVPFVLADPVR